LKTLKHRHSNLNAAVTDPIEVEGGEELELGMAPTDAQLEKINLYIPANATPLTATDVITVPIIASNNLVQWTNDCWHPRSLEAMAKDMPGRAFIINHGDNKGGMWGTTWDSVKTHRGRIYDARHMVYDTAPDELLDCANNGKVNRQIVSTFGYHVLEVDVFIDRDSDIAEQIRYGTHLDVSTGTVGAVKYFCPICSNFDSGNEIEFTDEDCPHYPPTNRVMEMTRYGDLSPEQELLVAPYMVQDGVDYSVEISSVCIGNLPSARIVSRRDILEGVY
jgi:hypothetical protein